MIRTHRLSLIPLTRQQLETGLLSVKQLSVDMNLPVVSDILDEGFAVAARKKLTLMSDLPPELHTWFTFWLIVLDCDNIGIGMAGFKSIPDANGSVEIGYGINSIFQGRGYMTECVEALVDWAFSHPECRQVIANTAPDNYASRKVLIKTGFKETDSNSDEVIYVKTPD